MGTWVRDKGKGTAADMSAGRVPSHAVQRVRRVAGESGGEDTGPEQQRSGVGTWVGNSVLTWIEDLMSVPETENHSVDRIMSDPDQGVKQDLGEPG